MDLSNQHMYYSVRVLQFGVYNVKVQTKENSTSLQCLLIWKVHMVDYSHLNLFSSPVYMKRTHLCKYGTNTFFPDLRNARPSRWIPKPSASFFLRPVRPGSQRVPFTPTPGVSLRSQRNTATPSTSMKVPVFFGSPISVG